jgi:hypothetical protein
VIALICVSIGLGIVGIAGIGSALAAAAAPALMGLAMAFGALAVLACLFYAVIDQMKVKDRFPENSSFSLLWTNTLRLWVWMKANPLKAFAGFLAFAALGTVILLGVGYLTGAFAPFMAPVFTFMNAFITPALLGLGISPLAANVFLITLLAVGALFIFDFFREALPYQDGAPVITTRADIEQAVGRVNVKNADDPLSDDLKITLPLNDKQHILFAKHIKEAYGDHRYIVPEGVYQPQPPQLVVT